MMVNFFKLEGYGVVIAEKPSVAKDIAFAIAKEIGGRAEWDGSSGYKLKNGCWVTYTGGHIVELGLPEDYLGFDSTNQNAFEYLPLIPEFLERRPRILRTDSGSPLIDNGQYVTDPHYLVLKREMQKADFIVNAGDVGREGQLIFDSLVQSCGLDCKGDRIYRVRIIDQLNLQVIASALCEMTSNGDPIWQASSAAAKCRQEADWLLGFNMSRAYQTIFGNQRIALGRLKCVVLSFLCLRKKEIEEFKPTTYYQPIVILADGSELKWRARIEYEGQFGFDHDGRIVNKDVCEQIISRINQGIQGRVLRVISRNVKTPPPLPFNKATLEIEGSKRFGMTVDEISNISQNLYLKKLISYVRTDCQYIPESVLTGARDLMASLSPAYRALMSGANSTIHPASFSDAKIGNNEHHGIIPTGQLSKDLEEGEKKVFDLVVERFAQQFYPDHECRVFGYDVQFGSDVFSSERQFELVRTGWAGNNSFENRESILAMLDDELFIQFDDKIETICETEHN